MGIYWNREGKYQKELDELHEKYSVDYGYTSSPIMNMFLSANKIYYDYYNNGGCNLNFADNQGDYGYMSELIDYIVTGLNEIESSTTIDNINLLMETRKLFKLLDKENEDGEYFNLESIMDNIIKISYDNIKPFPIFTIYFDSNNDLISRNVKLSNTITFGIKEEEENWYKCRSVGSTVVSTVEEKADAFERKLEENKKALYEYSKWKKEATKVLEKISKLKHYNIDKLLESEEN